MAASGHSSPPAGPFMTPVSPPSTLEESILTAWRTNNRVTAYLIENLPAAIWDAPIPGARRSYHSLS